MKAFVYILFTISISLNSFAQKTDTIQTKNGKVIIHFVGHGSLMFEYNGKIIHIDPWSRAANYDSLPKADAVLLTHHHQDHLDSIALAIIFTGSTELYWTKQCACTSKFKANDKIVSNGDTFNTSGITVRAVQAYNILNKRNNGEPYHIKGEGNGYILNIDNTTIYIAGDTESIPEMNKFGKIDIAFLPMNIPFTMTPEIVKDAVLALKPKILYPYHYGKTDTNLVVELLKDYKEIEVRIR
ncbi:metal-dependent hydrolase [Tenuifilaceae bacterium CYCD]|nr:metal-dependent hydrolase [Tenuifilaceae bacterium CYCD]